MTRPARTRTGTHGAVTVDFTVTGPVQENTLFVRDAAGEGFIVDPGDEAPRLLEEVRALGLRPRAILLTHAHFDHVGAVQPLREALGVPVYLHEADLPLYRAAASSAARWNLSVTQPADPDGC
ncbi:MBL fold metallo-hydrolase, partial [Deinococcus pimensis]|uniref:MBL fold metallo-hydrolase n=1 Tax=Deinococcus pimensis TaxID=309888 RepID=UPI0012FC9278